MIEVQKTLKIARQQAYTELFPKSVTKRSKTQQIGYLTVSNNSWTA